MERRSGGRPGQANSTLRQQGGPVALKTGVGSWGLRPKVRTDARPPAGRASLLPKGSRYSEARGGVLKGHWCGGGGGRARPPSGQDAALHCGGLGPVPGPGTEAPKPQGRAYTGASMNRSAEAQLIHAPGLWHTAQRVRYIHFTLFPSPQDAGRAAGPRRGVC